MPVSEIAEAATWASERRAEEDGRPPQDRGDPDCLGPGKTKRAPLRGARQRDPQDQGASRPGERGQVSGRSRGLTAELPLVAWLGEMCSQARVCMGVHTQAHLYTRAHTHAGERWGEEAPWWRQWVGEAHGP